VGTKCEGGKLGSQGVTGRDKSLGVADLLWIWSDEEPAERRGIRPVVCSVPCHHPDGLARSQVHHSIHGRLLTISFLVISDGRSNGAIIHHKVHPSPVFTGSRTCGSNKEIHSAGRRCEDPRTAVVTVPRVRHDVTDDDV